METDLVPSPKHGWSDSDHQRPSDSASTHSSLSVALRQATTNRNYAPQGRSAHTYPRSSYKRDELYYFEDGSCILLVCDTLFNVHRSMLRKHSSKFSLLFSLPQVSNGLEGQSDDNPVILTGDTPDEFRHFLWALYASPPVASPATNLERLIHIIRISHKYAFCSLETWALDTIQDYINQNPSPVLVDVEPRTSSSTSSTSSADTEAKSQGTPALLVQHIRLAHLSQHERLFSTLTALLRHLMVSSDTYTYLAMTIADEFGLRTLRGAAYFKVLQSGIIGFSSERTKPNISLAQRFRLLSGYYRLTSAWAAFRELPFEHSHSCTIQDQSRCATTWAAFWSHRHDYDSVMDLGLADIPGRLRAMQKEYGWGRALGMHDDCQVVAVRAVGQAIERAEDSLPDYFVDPAESEENSRAEQFRLLYGYYHLTSTWQAICVNPPVFKHSQKCNGSLDCVQYWAVLWKERTRSTAVGTGPGMADLLGRLRLLKVEIQKYESMSRMHDDCRVEADKKIDAMIKYVQRALPAYFVDPGVWDENW
ncbi:hypothetical protein GALMADRAFT_56967 [Galerina marginata CBS 339.88]|uniref:BTB domain-containing protein n=1 Tax=Galerina marginata (strain CBS 339.88) TaxID=685588 RepID=A0A067TIQ4_GALM3|nr:hypothetical protein GALMADRAFT_56967 [Galerina marginata CBS 339.88]